MRIKLQLAAVADVAELVELRNAAADRLTELFGPGRWSDQAREKGVLFGMRRGSVYIARYRDQLIATLTLSTRKPWAIDTTYFSQSLRPLYLTGMTVHPRYQNKGVGTGCLVEARRIAREWPGDAIRLDAWDAAAGAGDFYRKCGYREVGRASYRGTPLLYFELIL